MDNQYPDLCTQFRDILKEKMKMLGLSQRELAKRVGLSDAQVSRFLNEDNVNYTGKSIQKFANALGYHPVLNLTKKKTEEPKPQEPIEVDPVEPQS